MEDNNTGVYITLTLYLLLTALVTWLANRDNRKEEAREGEETLIKTHFLGGKNLDLRVLYLTSFATYFSGYTCVGVPNDAFKQGYNSFRWIGGHLLIGLGMIALYPRLRTLSKMRNYESPGDFVMDRFPSKPLRLLCTISMCVPLVLYISVQFHSLGSLASQLTDGNLNFYAVVVVCVVICLSFEFLGGMRSVAYTDSVESVVMIIIFVIVPSMLLARHGGFAGQVAFGDEECANSQVLPSGNETQRVGCVNYAVDQSNVPNFYIRTPSMLTNVNMLIFHLSGASFFITPMQLQRLYMGKSDSDVKLVTASQFLNSYIAMPCGILIGLTVLANKASYQPEFQRLDGFFMFISTWLYEKNFFVSGLMYFLILAAMAGIMSTADSSLIGVSNTVSVDIFRNWLTPNASPRKIVFIGKLVSIVTAMMGAGVAMYLEATKDANTGVNYSVLLSLQGGIGWQILPAFILGIYSDISASVILRGCALGLSTFLGLAVYNVIIAGANKKDDIETIWTAMNPDAVQLNAAINALCGALINFGYCVVAHYCSTNRHKVDQIKEQHDTRYGPVPLTHETILDAVGHKSEPIFCLPAFGIAASVFLQFFVRLGPVDGDLKGNLLFNGEPNKIIAGLPAWAFWQLLVTLMGSACGFWTVMQWDVREDATTYMAEISMSGTTPYVPLDPDED
jgi:SSS family solute:Na+ symporter/sodium/pantothenate symporter